MSEYRWRKVQVIDLGVPSNRDYTTLDRAKKFTERRVLPTLTE